VLGTPGKTVFQPFNFNIMTNLTEIFQFLNDYDQESIDNHLRRSAAMFSATGQSRSIFIAQIKSVERIESWITSLVVDNSAYELSDGEYSIDFIFLCDSLKEGLIRDMYIRIKGIRAEMLAITTPGTFEEFKQLNEFWETLELCFQVMMK
jgi:hypothetical protein